MSQRIPEPPRHFAAFFSPKQISDAFFAQSQCDFLPFAFNTASSSILSLVGTFFLKSLPCLTSHTNFSPYAWPQSDSNFLSFSWPASYSLAPSTPHDSLEFDYATQNLRAVFQQTDSSLDRRHSIFWSNKKHDRFGSDEMVLRSQQSWPDSSETGWKLQSFNVVEEGNANSRHHQQAFKIDTMDENGDSRGLMKARECLEKASPSLDSTTVVQTSKHLLAGAVSAMVSRTLVAPLERIKLEYIVRGAKDDVLRTMQSIFKREGVKGFWKGNLVNLIRTAPFKSLNFYAYDTFRKQMLHLSGKSEVSNWEKFAAGAAAGVTASIICFPMDTVRTRMVAPGGEALGNIISCFRYMIEKEGPLSLYAGLLPALVSMAPSGAVFYGVYDILKTSYLSSPKSKKNSRGKRPQMKLNESREKSASTDQLELGPMRTLLFGAIAGACAETITYPLEVIRRQLQLQDAVKRLGMVATAKGIVEKGGIGALYAGLLPSTFQVLPSAAISYLVYETMKVVWKVS